MITRIVLLYCQQLKDEKEKKIRGQEAELRKLVSDMQEMTATFDKEALDLFNQRLQVSNPVL
jgi:hypothetical protein